MKFCLFGPIRSELNHLGLASLVWSPPQFRIVSDLFQTRSYVSDAIEFEMYPAILPTQTINIALFNTKKIVSLQRLFLASSLGSGCEGDKKTSNSSTSNSVSNII